MSLVKWALLGAMLVPAAEIAIFVAIASQIGILATLAVTFATSLAGVAVARAAATARIDPLRRTVHGRNPDQVTLLAGILLIIPGFLTDLLGAALLVRPVRQKLLGAWRAVVENRWARAPRDAVVDLHPDEWYRVPDDPP